MTTLLVIAKEPVPGRVKTRLTPPFSPAQAAALAEAALADTLQVLLDVPASRRVVVLDGRPGAWLPPGYEVVPQAGGGLDERLAAAFSLVRGPAFLVGMDTPQLTPDLLALDWRAADAWFGPAADGGFWGFGLRRPDPALLRGVPMSTPYTGAVQRARLVGAGLRVRDLPVLRDVDTAPDAHAAAAAAPWTRFAERLHAIAREAWPVPLYEDALRAGGAELRLYDGDRSLRLDVARWCAAPDDTDAELLDRCAGPTLDVGCGPGRLVAALAGRGVPVLGVDIAPAAVALTLASGGLVLRRSVFDRVPGEGRWATVLLADGNVGIGGDPAALLDRVRALLHPRGRALVEVEPHDVDERLLVHVEDGHGRRSERFPWARLGARAAAALAGRAGLSVAETWCRRGRSFLALTPRRS